jgi:DNA-directed RNA polymerase subunit RPC12/RpoP
MPAQDLSPSTPSFGTDDAIVCPECGGEMFVTRRAPDVDHGAAYERQVLTCFECGHELERSIDAEGNPPCYLV